MTSKTNLKTVLDMDLSPLEQDVFTAFYAPPPVWNFPVDLEAFAHRDLIAALVETRTYKYISQLTAGDAGAAGYMALLVTNELEKKDASSFIEWTEEELVTELTESSQAFLGVQEIVNSLGLVHELSQQDPEDAYKAWARLGASQEVRDLLHYMRPLTTALEAIRDGKPEPQSLGNDIQNLVGLEIVRMVQKDLDPSFWARYSGHALNVREPGGGKAMSEQIILLDSSSSMTDVKLAEAKGIALAFSEAAHAAGTTTTTVMFAGDRLRTFQMMEDRSSIIDFASQRSQGTSEFTAALDWAAAMANPGDHIIIITDEAEVTPTPAWKSMRDLVDVHVTGIMIGIPENPSLKAISDEYRNLFDF